MKLHSKPSLLAGALFLAAATVAARAADSTYPEGVEVKAYTGWNSAIHLGSGEVKAVIVPDAGGRLFRYAVNRENIIFENPDTAGRVLGDPNENWSFGGFQMDLGPELRGIPKHDELWRGRYSWHVPGPFSVRLTSKVDPATGMQMEKDFVIDPDNGDLGITTRMINASDRETSYCQWDRTLCLGGGFAVIPLNRKSHFLNRWALRVGERGKDWRYDGGSPLPREAKVLRNHLVVHCQGPATKLGVDSNDGWIAYVRGSQMLVKYYPFYPDGDYTDGRCSVQLYYDEKVAELEPLSPEVPLQPGQSFTFPQKWVLIDLKKPVNNHDDALDAVRQIPGSPF